MTTSDLDLQKNLNNLEEFKRNVNYLRGTKNDLWIHLLVSGELSIDTKKVHSYYKNARTHYKLDVWDTKPTNKMGVFRPFHNLLEHIQFHFTG